MTTFIAPLPELRVLLAPELFSPETISKELAQKRSLGETFGQQPKIQITFLNHVCPQPYNANGASPPCFLGRQVQPAQKRPSHAGKTPPSKPKIRLAHS